MGFGQEMTRELVTEARAWLKEHDQRFTGWRAPKTHVCPLCGAPLAENERCECTR